MKELCDLLYEETRQLLINSNRIGEKIAQLENQKVKRTISEMVKTVQADLLILLELLGDISSSLECEWEEIIQRYENE
ncbi:MAG: hypothetical protein HXY50_16090 [Ignavibacteriaceae bacterium]|nr:hypothetical protein [Ignavibacteriaceae bacterium]